MKVKKEFLSECLSIKLKIFMETNGGLASKPKENAKLTPTSSKTLYRLYRQRNQAVEIAQLL